MWTLSDTHVEDTHVEDAHVGRENPLIGTGVFLKPGARWLRSSAKAAYIPFQKSMEYAR